MTETARPGADVGEDVAGTAAQGADGDDASTTDAEANAAPNADGLPRREVKARGRKVDERPPLELARRIVELAEDKKAADIALLELAPLTTLADYFVICSGGS